MIAVPAVPPPLDVRAQEGAAPVYVGAGRAAAARYVRSHFRVRQVDASAWKPALELNWVVGFGGTKRRVAFFAHGAYLGADDDFGNIGQLGQVTRRASGEVVFALTLYRFQDSRCCPTGRTIRVSFASNGGRLLMTRGLLRTGVEPAEGLQLPSRNIGCIFGRSSGYTLRCDVRSGLRSAPPRPRGCDLDWAYGLSMTLTSRARILCAGDTALSQGPVLAYGATVRIAAFTCTSRRTGLRCTNGANHGFFLSRQRWRRF
jgi:hypothetical protein